MRLITVQIVNDVKLSNFFLELYKSFYFYFDKSIKLIEIMN
jgi:hypothetical protein